MKGVKRLFIIWSNFCREENTLLGRRDPSLTSTNMNPSSPPLIMVVSIVAAFSILVDTHLFLRVGRSFLRFVVQGGDLRAESIYQTKVCVFYLNIAVAFNMNTIFFNDESVSFIIKLKYVYVHIYKNCIIIVLELVVL